RAHTPLPDCFAQCRQHISIFYYKNYYCNTKSREARLGGALVSYEGLTNSIRSVAGRSAGTPWRDGYPVQKIRPQTPALLENIQIFAGRLPGPAYRIRTRRTYGATVPVDRSTLIFPRASIHYPV